jgi:hypothetical protein
MVDPEGDALTLEQARQLLEQHTVLQDAPGGGNGVQPMCATESLGDSMEPMGQPRVKCPGDLAGVPSPQTVGHNTV